MSARVERMPLPTKGTAMVIAVVLAATATAALYLYIRSIDDRTATADLVSVVVATSDIAAGTDLTDAIADGAFRSISVPADVAVPGAITDVSELEGRATASAIVAGEQIPTARLEGTVVGGTLGIPAQHEALTVALEAPRAAGGAIRKNDHVTVYGTFKGLSDDASGGSATVVLVPNVEVLDVSSPVAGGLGSSDAELSITLALRHRDAQDVVFALEQGSVWLGLLPPGEQAPNRDRTTLFEIAR